MDLVSFHMARMTYRETIPFHIVEHEKPIALLAVTEDAVFLQTSGF